MSTHNNPETELLPIEPELYTREYMENPGSNQDRDVDQLRKRFGRRPYDREAYEEYKHDVYPGMIEHNWDGPLQGATREKGGTDCLATGPPGSGKSTWNLHLAERLMEENDEMVVWRGSTARSEWLPYAPVTRLCLPADVDVNAMLVPTEGGGHTIEDVPLEDVVREVVRYDSTRDLNANHLEPGMFHVVYPDPRMRGCQAAYESSDEKQYEAPPDRMLFEPEDPSNHWWFGWVLDRIEYGPYAWTSWIADEIGDIAPQSARSDEFATYQKVELLKDSFVDARKTGLSLFASGHNEGDIHDKVRKKMRWRIQMPGQANPTRESQVAGFNSVPMDHTMTEDWQPGELLVYNERRFDKIEIGPIEPPFDHKLKLSMEAKID